MSIRQGDAVAPERVWGYDEFPGAEQVPAAELTAGLISLRFLGTALRRRAWFWCATALAGMVIGLGLFAAYPPAYQSSASVLVTNDPNEDPGNAIQTDLDLAQTPAVAQGALQRLGLRDSVSSLLAAYTVVILNDRILQFTVNAPTSGQAVARADALAAAFLQFRAHALQIEQQVVIGSLAEEISVAQGQLSTIAEQIADLGPQPPGQKATPALQHLQKQQYQAKTALSGLQNLTAAYPVTRSSMVAGSRVLDSAIAGPRPHRLILFYPLGGLFVGLVLGVGVVITGGINSDRLRRRDDVAEALGAPLNLSVGHVPAARWLPGRRRLALARSQDVRRIVAHLRRAVPADARHAALAAVAVDNARLVALPLVSLAALSARQGQRVVLADLSPGAPAARLLGVRKPGIREVSAHGARLAVVVPGRDDPAPAGPLGPGGAPGSSGPAALADVYQSADLVLTLASLHPALGAEHIATWATGAVIVVTAGRSSQARIRAVGEMTELAGLRQVSAVLIGADKADVSLGVTSAPSRWAQPVPAVRISR